jgi:hypothetical protein
MKLFSLEEDAQVKVSNETPNTSNQDSSDKPIFDKSMFGEGLKTDGKKKVKLFDAGELM